jgi:hypothetical protein
MNSVRALACGLALCFAAVPAMAQEGGKGMQPKVLVDEKNADWLVGNLRVTTYRLEGYPRPIFWPVYAPGGQHLTRDWPMEQAVEGGSKDHIHQKSLWFCHGDVIPEGIDLKQRINGVEGVDFWSEAPGHGKIVPTKSAPGKSGDAHAVLQTHNEWRTADGVKILDEDRAIHLYPLGKANLVVLRIDLHASVAPITFGDTKEGALGVRINDVIRAGKFGKGKIENALGKTGESECWGRIADWCDYSGPIDGKTVGLAVYADPKNAHPTYWHVRDYGLMAANPFGRKKAAFHDGAAGKDLVKLAKGEHLELRFGILLHEGDASGGRVADSFKQFVKLRDKE